MNKKLIAGTTVPVDGRAVSDCSLLLGDGKILEIGYEREIPEDCEVISLEGGYLVPSFVELHAHGGGGMDFADCTKESFDGVMKTHLSHGVTCLCPTLVASDWKKTLDFLRLCDSFGKNSFMFGGVHLEGPFLSPDMCGAQNLANIILPTNDKIDELLEFSSILSCITAAPEISGAELLAKKMTAKGVSMSVGHSNADAKTVNEAAEWGFDRVTHLFCSTSRRTKRGSYVVGGIEEAALIDDRFTVELIGDGHHISRESFLLTMKCKGKSGVAAVSDAMRAAGCADDITESFLGEKLPENRVIIEDGVAKLPDRSSFAGSVAVGDTMMKALCMEYGFSLADVSHMMSTLPAKLAGLENCGKIERGAAASLTLLDSEYKTRTVFLNGEKVYEK